MMNLFIHGTFLRLGRSSPGQKNATTLAGGAPTGYDRGERTGMVPVQGVLGESRIMPQGCATRHKRLYVSLEEQFI